MLILGGSAEEPDILFWRYKNKMLKMSLKWIFQFIIVLTVSTFLSVCPSTYRAYAEDISPGEIQEQKYRFSSGDVLSIKVFEAKELNSTARVDFDGFVTLPLLGPVKVQGLAERELEQKLEALLEEKYLHHPQVSVFVKESGYFYVLGNVEGVSGEEGKFPYQPGISLQQAIAMAGGFLKNEDDFVESIHITRDIVGGGKETIIVDYDRIIEGRLRDIPVMKGDVVFVKNLGRFYVSGYVRRPGGFDLRQDTTLQQAIALGGGFVEIEEADLKRIQIIRNLTGGGEEILFANYNRILDGTERDIPIREDDVIFVMDLGSYYVGGYVRRPGEFDLRSDTTLRQAISTAGGVDEVGRDTAVQITRVSEDGEVEIITVNLKDIIDGEAEDIKIEDDDVIHIPRSYILSFAKAFFLSIGVGDRSTVGITPTTFIER